MEKLVLKPLENAVVSLGKALEQPKDEFIRDAVIQRFECTYELCVKMLAKKLKEDYYSAEEIDHMTFKDLVRTAGQKGLIEDVEAWFEYRKKRNWTSHTYDEAKAEIVFAAVKTFFPDAEKLLIKLKS